MCSAIVSDAYIFITQSRNFSREGSIIQDRLPKQNNFISKLTATQMQMKVQWTALFKQTLEFCDFPYCWIIFSHGYFTCSISCVLAAIHLIKHFFISCFWVTLHFLTLVFSLTFFLLTFFSLTLTFLFGTFVFLSDRFSRQIRQLGDPFQLLEYQI